MPLYHPNHWASIICSSTSHYVSLVLTPAIHFPTPPLYRTQSSATSHLFPQQMPLVPLSFIPSKLASLSSLSTYNLLLSPPLCLLVTYTAAILSPLVMVSLNPPCTRHSFPHLPLSQFLVHSLAIQCPILHSIIFSLWIFHEFSYPPLHHLVLHHPSPSTTESMGHLPTCYFFLYRKVHH